MTIAKDLFNKNLDAYVTALLPEETPAQIALREKTATMAMASMQISPDQARLMQILIKLIQAKNIIEIGVFTGYSSLSMALALPTDGKIIACDINKEWTDMAQKFWEMAGVKNKIELKLQPALTTLKILQQTKMAAFDLVFIDADKENYVEYYENALLLVRQNGLILVDNTLWGGQVMDAADQSENTQQIRRLHQLIAKDPRVESCLLTIRDGLTMVRKI